MTRQCQKQQNRITQNTYCSQLQRIQKRIFINQVAPLPQITEAVRVFRTLNSRKLAIRI